MHIRRATPLEKALIYSFQKRFLDARVPDNGETAN